jgi:hypothetical protein
MATGGTSLWGVLVRMTDTTPNCKQCQYQTLVWHEVQTWCTRFPEWKQVDDTHYCGEFKKVQGESVYEEIVKAAWEKNNEA